MVPLSMWSTKFTKWFVVAVSGSNVKAGSISLFTAITESMNLKVGDIGANHLPVYLDLGKGWNSLMQMIPFLLKMHRTWFIPLQFVLP